MSARREGWAWGQESSGSCRTHRRNQGNRSEVKLEPALNASVYLTGGCSLGKGVQSTGCLGMAGGSRSGHSATAPTETRFPSEKELSLGSCLVLRALGLVGGVPKPNLLIRSAQPGPASPEVASSFPLCQQLARGRVSHTCRLSRAGAGWQK